MEISLGLFEKTSQFQKITIKVSYQPLFSYSMQILIDVYVMQEYELSNTLTNITS